MKYEIICEESIKGARIIRAIVEANSEDEALDNLYNDEYEDWDVKEESFDPVDMEVLSIKEINDTISD